VTHGHQTRSFTRFFQNDMIVVFRSRAGVALPHAGLLWELNSQPNLRPRVQLVDEHIIQENLFQLEPCPLLKKVPREWHE